MHVSLSLDLRTCWENCSRVIMLHSVLDRCREMVALGAIIASGHALEIDVVRATRPSTGETVSRRTCVRRRLNIAYMSKGRRGLGPLPLII